MLSQMLVYKLSNESLKDPGKGLKHMYITYLMAVGSFRLPGAYANDR